MTGSLDIQFGSDSSRSFGVSGIAENRTVSILFGDEQNSITHTKGSPIILEAKKGLQIQSDGEQICLFGSNDRRVYFHRDILMNNNFIGNVHDPRSQQDVVNKRYLESKFFKNQTGFIPALHDNIFGKNGFISSASSEKPTGQAFRAFALTGEWIASITTDPIFIQIKCPFPIRIHKIGLRGRRIRTENVKKWTLQGSNDGVDFTDLLIKNSVIDTSLQFYGVTCLETFSYYKLNILEFEGTAPGLNYFQIYSLDPID
ncbi:hypothetical protein [Methanosarcina sp.]|uniref:hypothetical protein n=1 Tax=Methanosarcina sp. TaxID=2213 RepID=UPI003BB4AE7E